MSSSTYYDLLPSNCDTFKVVFDVFTPRPHFIILYHDEGSVSHDYNILNKEARLKVIKAAMAMVSSYELQTSAILSLHCGSWISKKTSWFHAHVCVDVHDYLRIFDNKKKEIPDSLSTKIPKDYAQRVQKYSQTFWEHEVKAIKISVLSATKTAKEAPTDVSSIPPNFTTVGFAVDNAVPVDDDSPNSTSAELHLKAQEASFDFAVNDAVDVEESVPSATKAAEEAPTDASSSPPNFTILYHPSEPRVGYSVDDAVAVDDDSPNSTIAKIRLKAQEALFEFASCHNLTDNNSKDDNDGCHVCLVLDGEAHGFDLTDSQSLVGYIQVTGPKFYRDICPEERREQWFAEFEKKKDYNVYT